MHVPLPLAEVALTRVDDVSMRRKSLAVRFSVEEPHGVPFTSNSTQTRRRVSQGVAGHLVDRHLTSESDVIVDVVA